MKKKTIKEYGGKEKYKSKAVEKKEKMHKMPNGKMMKGAKHKGKK